MEPDNTSIVTPVNTKTVKSTAGCKQPLSESTVSSSKAEWSGLSSLDSF